MKIGSEKQRQYPKHRLGFALEYSLGHTTHAQNLKRVLAEEPSLRSVTPVFVDLPFAGGEHWWEALPGVRSNWSVRASIGAYLGLRRAQKTGRLDAALFHTQVTALFSAGLMRQVPSVVSLDATPIQYDALGAFYNHVAGGNSRIEALKKRMNQRAFSSAHHLVTWSQWAKESLIQDYQVQAAKVTVIAPGINVEAWNPAHKRKSRLGGTVHLLFVGGDWKRKGGDVLAEAWRSLPQAVRARAHLHLVTREARAGDGLENTTVYTDLTPNSPGLLELFWQADVFVFPTFADCLPLAVLEACAAGLPVITTDVGALPEAVTHGQTGLVVPVGNAVLLAEAITTLVQDGSLRERLGNTARQTAVLRFDAARNYRALVDRVVLCAEERKAR